MNRGVVPAEWLAEGSTILAPVLEAAGFKRGTPETGIGSGGSFAWLRWRRGGQFIETHIRWTLGMVRYGWDGESFSHEDYLRCRGLRGEYPGFSHDPIDGFRHLVNDLRGPAAVLLTMNRAEFMATAEDVRRQPKLGLP